MAATRDSSRVSLANWLALRVAAPLLAFAVIHCGGQANRGEPAGAGASGGGASSIGGSPEGGASQFLSAGRSWMDEHEIVIPDGGAPDTYDCNALSDWPPAVSSTFSTGEPPTPQGGSISNGFYRLTKVEVFVGPDGDISQYPDRLGATLAISASSNVGADLQLNWVWMMGELPRPVEQSQTIITAGTSYAYTVTCTTDRAATEPGSIAFTATTDELAWIVPQADGNTRVSTFTRE